MENNRFELNKNLAQMLKGGVIMDVTTPEQAKIAEAAGACAVMALERIPADIRAAGGVSRMSAPEQIGTVLCRDVRVHRYFLNRQYKGKRPRDMGKPNKEVIM